MKTVRLKIPGKVMLAGEYSVLRGGHALAVTVDRYMTIEVESNPSLSYWTIQSDLWNAPKMVSDLRIPESDPLCRAVQACARRFNLQGGRVTVTSEIRVQDGLGSSSALRVGVCAAMDLIKNGRHPERTNQIAPECIQNARDLQVEAQGYASGYDIATQYIGGLVEFYADHSSELWKPHWFKLPLEYLGEAVHLFSGGSGAPTATTLQTTNAWLDTGHKVERLLDISENLIDAFLAHIRFPCTLHFKKLVDAVAAHRGLFGASPLFPTEIATALSETPGHDSKWTWKTTGAGGEDAILLIGSLEAVKPAIKTLYDRGWSRLAANFIETGIVIESLTEEPKVKPAATSRAHTFPTSIRTGLGR